MKRIVTHAEETHRGTIFRIVTGGLAFLTDDDSGASYTFSFDKLKGYQGDQPKALGLEAGARVTFTVSDNTVCQVEIAADELNLELGDISRKS